ncbi:MAG: insulinase family protein [Prevotellaceae bacterium]|jgi:predicted Zn-dependent peptidase|nr:insulinase family protein [Prevotellaceae bacterium]
MNNECEIIHLSNGIRAVLQKTQSSVVYCGLTIGTGTANELADEQGIAHFIEHVLFKGTKKRSARDICYGLEHNGGELNAFTSRESTIVYSIVQNSQFEKALEIICDLVFNSTFPETELNREKGVIISEINSSKCNLSEVIYDKSMQLLFKGNAIGKPILGTIKSVKSFTADNVRTFVKRNYINRRIVLSVVGNIDTDKLNLLANKYLMKYNNDSDIVQCEKISEYKPFKKEFQSDSAQAFCIISNRAYNISDSRSTGLSLLTNMLGGPIFSSLLNLSLREQNGLVYDISSSYEAYTSSGVFQIYFETARKNLKKSIKLALAELENLRSGKINKSDLDYAKKRFIGQLVIQNENYEQRMIDNAKMLLMFDKIETIDIQKSKINALKSEDLYKIANDIFVENNLSFISYS